MSCAPWLVSGGAALAWMNCQRSFAHARLGNATNNGLAAIRPKNRCASADDSLTLSCAKRGLAGAVTIACVPARLAAIRGRDNTNLGNRNTVPAPIASDSSAILFGACDGTKVQTLNVYEASMTRAGSE